MSRHYRRKLRAVTNQSTTRFPRCVQIGWPNSVPASGLSQTRRFTTSHKPLLKNDLRQFSSAVASSSACDAGGKRRARRLMPTQNQRRHVSGSAGILRCEGWIRSVASGVTSGIATAVRSPGQSDCRKTNRIYARHCKRLTITAGISR